MLPKWTPAEGPNPAFCDFAASFGNLGFVSHFGSNLGRLGLQKIAVFIGGVSKNALLASCENGSNVY